MLLCVMGILEIIQSRIARNYPMVGYALTAHFSKSLIVSSLQLRSSMPLLNNDDFTRTNFFGTRSKPTMRKSVPTLHQNSLLNALNSTSTSTRTRRGSKMQLWRTKPIITTCVRSLTLAQKNWRSIVRHLCIFAGKPAAKRTFHVHPVEFHIPTRLAMYGSW